MIPQPLEAAGRVIQSSTSELVVDADLPQKDDVAYRLVFVLPDGSLDQRSVDAASISGRSISMIPLLDTVPLIGAMWALSLACAERN